jgi:hypothetical protein
MPIRNVGIVAGNRRGRKAVACARKERQMKAGGGPLLWYIWRGFRTRGSRALRVPIV